MFSFKVKSEEAGKFAPTEHQIPQKGVATRVAQHLLKSYVEVELYYNGNLLSTIKRPNDF